MAYDCIDRGISRLFALYGGFLARHPLPFLVLPVLLAGGLGAGMYFMVSDSSVEGLYTPDNGRGKTERAEAEQHFPVNDSEAFQPSRIITLGRSASVIVTSKGLDDVLRISVLREVLSLYSNISGLEAQVSGTNYTFADLCATWQSRCVVDGYQLLNFTLEKDENTTIGYPWTNLPGGTRLFSGATLGGVTLEPGTEDVSTAAAFKLTFYLRSENPEDDKLSEEWEKAFLSYMDNFESDIIDVSQTSSQSLEEELSELTPRIIPRFSITFTVLITFSIFSCMMLDMVRTKPWLGMLGVVSAGMAVVSSMGLCLYCGVKFTSVVASMPFLIIGIGVDDMFIMIAAWRKTHPGGSVEKRMEETYAEAAVSITITTITDGLAFGIGAITVFPAIRIFCIYTGVAVLFDYFFQVTFFGACMVYVGRREKANRHAATCMRAVTPSEAKDRSGCYRLFCTGNTLAGVNEKGEFSGSDHAIMTFFKDYFGPFITKTWVKVIVMLMFAGYLGCAMWGCLQLREGIRLSNLAADDSYVVSYNNKDDQNFMSYGAKISVGFTDELEYWNTTVQSEIENTLSLFEETSFTSGKNETESWLRDYLDFIDQFSSIIPGLNASRKEPFITNLKDHFLTNVHFKRYELDIEFNDNKSEILASRFLVQTKEITNSVREKEMVIKMRDLADQSPFQTTVYHPSFIFYDQYIAILPNTLQNLGIATATMFVVALVLVPHPVCSVWVTLSIASICTGVVGYMTLWDVNLDAISMINIIMCIGFSVDFSAHITYAFVSCKEDSSNARSVFALYTLGMPILQGSLSTILGVAALSTAPSYIFRTFFKTMFLVILLGAMHGLVVLPVLLTFMGPGACRGRQVVRETPSGQHRNVLIDDNMRAWIDSLKKPDGNNSKSERPSSDQSSSTLPTSSQYTYSNPSFEPEQTWSGSALKA
ncbi:PREDICTED: patched domain-containing protein 3-like [Branchiostoma belcheri]|uniref:Patched domain-containing protein 3 n=1 Tax=Branchiostoma belcheri TaxID=7741 RepID=A0A6P4YWI6_BRABE|nr:PREDICTED: patched domain-containing protein 3-like [Branchiostoma belcheri]